MRQHVRTSLLKNRTHPSCLPRQHVTAFEHWPLPIGDVQAHSGVTLAEADQLLAIGETRPGFCERGYRSIRLAHYVGVVTLGDRALEILPKIADLTSAAECRGILLRLLRRADQFPLFRHLSVTQSLRSAPL